MKYLIRTVFLVAIVFGTVRGENPANDLEKIDLGDHLSGLFLERGDLVGKVVVREDVSFST